MKWSVSPSMVVATTAVVIAASGGAYAAVRGSEKPISACVHADGHGLYLARKCAAGDRRVTWNTAGPRGAKGNAGKPGAVGATGATGLAGVGGLSGAKGATGAAGTRGTTGASGSKGATGATGTNGTPGTTGPIGPTGATGSGDGATGATGATGVTGTAGVAGGPIAAGYVTPGGPDGSGTPTISLQVGTVSVMRAGLGDYCLTVAGADPTTAGITLTMDFATDSTSFYNDHGGPDGTSFAEWDSEDGLACPHGTFEVVVLQRTEQTGMVGSQSVITNVTNTPIDLPFYFSVQ